MTALPLTW